MELTKEDIIQINIKCPFDQGIFFEPYGIPTDVKEPVIYMRWTTGGVEGGSCWASSNPQTYVVRDPKPRFEVLDIVLRKLKPELTYLQYREIEGLIHSNSITQWAYYGNSDDYDIDYIILSELIEKLENF